MYNFQYSLHQEDYSWKNALLWGNFIEHCKRSRDGSWDERAVHVLIAGLEFLPIIGQIASIFEKLILNYFEPPVERNQQILEISLKSKAIKALYEKANATPSYSNSGAWKIQFANNSYFEGDAECRYWERKIILSSGLSDEKAISCFVFELINGINAHKHKALDNKSRWGEIEREEFVKETEYIEYEGTLLHHEVIQEAIKEMNWNESLDLFSYQSDDFESYWEWIKTTSHAEYYRSTWDNDARTRSFLKTLLKITNLLKKSLNTLR